jgi:hypothetical protein
MQHIDVSVDDQEFALAASQAHDAGISLEAWVRNLIRHATLPTDPLFGLLVDEPELADALDAVVAERGSRRSRL